MSVKSSARRVLKKKLSRPKTYLTAKGYRRFYSGPDRGKYEHRVVMRELCKVWCYYPLDENTGLPAGLDVHHVDFDKEHNCIGNLILLDTAIHVVISGWWHRIKQTGRYEERLVLLDWEVGWYEESVCQLCGRVKRTLVNTESKRTAMDTMPEWVYEPGMV